MTQKGQVLEVTLNRPQEGNSATDDMAAELTRLLEGAGDADLVILRGAGDDFCVGRSSMGRRPDGRNPEALARRRSTEVIFDCYNAFRKTPVPVIGVVQGRALGFGCSIAALCDITIASDRAIFQVPEMAHNILPTMVMSALSDRLGRKGLLYLVYSTAAVDAERAMNLGLVSEVVPANELEQAVQRMSAAILSAPRPARLGVKEYARSALHMDTQGAIDFARNLHATINSSSEMGRK